MTARAKPTFGTVFKMGPAGGTLVAIPRVPTLTPPQMTRDPLDATAHDSASGAMEFIGDGVFDPGELSISMNYIGGDATDDLFIAAMLDGELRDFSYTVKAGTGTETLEFSGVVTLYGPDELPVKGKQTATLTVKVSGPIAQAATV